MARIILRQGKTGKRYTAQTRAGSHSESKTFSTKTAAKEWSQRLVVELMEKPNWPPQGPIGALSAMP